jgi:hypothetical protein
VFASNLNDFFFSNQELTFPGERSIAFAGVPTPASIFTQDFGVLTYRVDPDAVMGSNLAFLMAASGGSLAGTRSNVYIGPTNTPQGQSTFLQGNLAIVGQGTSQQSAASLGIGRVVASLLGDNVNLDGRVRGSARLGASSNARFVSGPLGLSADLFGNAVFGTDGPNFAVAESSQISVGSGFSTSFSDFEATSLPVPVGLSESGTNPLVSTLYFPTNLAQRIDTPSGVGVSRQSRNLSGFASGFIDAFNTSGSLIANNAQFNSQFSGSPVGLFMTTNASVNTLSGSINGVTAGVSFALPFGGLNFDGRSAFIDDKLYGAVEGSTTATRNSVAATAFQMYVVGNELVATTGFLPAGASYSACTASTFGFWGMDLVHAGGRDRIHLGQFVAGVIPAGAERPQL